LRSKTNNLGRPTYSQQLAAIVFTKARSVRRPPQSHPDHGRCSKENYIE
jgi:hypothetical protein